MIAAVGLYRDSFLERPFLMRVVLRKEMHKKETPLDL